LDDFHEGKRLSTLPVSEKNEIVCVQIWLATKSGAQIPDERIEGRKRAGNLESRRRQKKGGGKYIYEILNRPDLY